jgi:kynurenine formamidase
VAKALEFLEILYGISSGYILIGHSCGATLAYQLTAQCGGATVPQPSTILGSEGIYNIPEMLKNHESPMYREFTVSAFGEDENVWKDVSPYYSKEPALWINCRTLIISHSEDDELVEKAQAYMMLEKFAKTSEFNGVVRYIPAFGNHDEIWGNPSEMARVIEAGLGMIQWPNANLTQSIEYI